MEWIKVVDQLPDKYENVLVCGYCTLACKNQVTIGYLNPDGYFVHKNKASSNYGIKNWMPLPDPPTTDK